MTPRSNADTVAVAQERLMQQAKAGEPAALGELLENQRQFLKLLARLEIGRQLQGKIGASDVVQDVFLKAHRQFTQFEGTDLRQFDSWLRAILAGTLANLARHYLGTQARDVRLEGEIAGRINESTHCLSQILIDPNSSPSQHAQGAEQARLVAEALAQLPADYQEVLLLRHIEGLTFPLIAERMSRSVDSVEKLWMRGLSKLRQQFHGPSA